VKELAASSVPQIAYVSCKPSDLCPRRRDIGGRRVTVFSGYDRSANSAGQPMSMLAAAFSRKPSANRAYLDTAWNTNT
jgi:hypothetical protein